MKNFFQRSKKDRKIPELWQKISLSFLLNLTQLALMFVQYKKILPAKKFFFKRKKTLSNLKKRESK